MTETELREAFARDLKRLDDSGAGMPFILKPSEAFVLLALLQLALRHPGVEGNSREFGTAFAQDIERRLGRTEALRITARLGWHPEYDHEKVQ